MAITGFTLDFFDWEDWCEQEYRKENPQFPKLLGLDLPSVQPMPSPPDTSIWKIDTIYYPPIKQIKLEITLNNDKSLSFFKEKKPHKIKPIKNRENIPLKNVKGI